jgi:hypothetical protein
MDATLESGLACICQKLYRALEDPAMAGIIDDGLADGTFTIDDPAPITAAPALDSDACAVAQLTWHWAYECLTEIIQPSQRGALAVLTPLALAAIASWIGTPVLGIPVGVLVVLFNDILDVLYEGSLQNVVNGLFEIQDDLVCALYDGMKDGGTFGDAHAAGTDVINAQEEFSPIDKIVMRGLIAPWTMQLMETGWTNLTDWATSRVEAGFCASCPEDAICGTDWCAVPYNGPKKTFSIDQAGSGGWLTECWPYTVPDGKHLAGMFYEVSGRYGGGSLKRMNAVSAGCPTTDSLWENTSDNLVDNWYFQYRVDRFDDQECHSMVRPDAVQQNQPFLDKTGPLDTSGAWQFGWNATGGATITIHYLVFVGNTWP